MTSYDIGINLDVLTKIKKQFYWTLNTDMMLSQCFSYNLHTAIIHKAHHTIYFLFVIIYIYYPSIYGEPDSELVTV